MADITTLWDAGNNRGDWLMVGPLLQSGSDLDTAVLISLFTDRVAGADDVIPDGTNDPRGWHADDSEHPIGSRLWLLSRSKQTSEVLGRARDYIAEALQWLIDDGVVARFEIYTAWMAPSFLGAQVVAIKPDGTAQTLNYQWAWSS